MAERPNEALSALTARLSRALASEEGTLLLAQTQTLRLLAAGQRGGRRHDAAKRSDLRIGIWEPDLREDGSVEFVRSANGAGDVRYWADIERIPAKSGKRVVLLGESVARGYFYDPAVTPARVLEAMLRSMGSEDAHVVDLARSDLTLGPLRRLFDPLPALEPDAVVLFAGNNWFYVRLALDHLGKLADAVRGSGFAGCREVFLREIVLPRVSSLLDRLAESTRAFAIPVLVIVPEFNLLDWRNEPSVLAPLLPEGRNLPWMRSLAAARAALTAGRNSEAAEHARELIDLDGGTSAASATLLAQAYLAEGCMSEARAAFERARDAPFGTLVALSPRCPTEIQELLRCKSQEHGFLLVDLPRVFEAHLLGGLPGREHFLDYCHLTIEGIRVAMAAAARELGPVLEAGLSSQSEIDTTPIEVEPTDESAAHFLAAIHNAHYGQPYEIVRHHCDRALALSESVDEEMRALLDCQSRRAETWMCAGFERLSRSPLIRRYLWPSDPRVLGKLADFPLAEAILDALAAAGADVRPWADGLLQEEHVAGEVDLLAHRYRATTFRERGGYSLGPERGYHQAHGFASRFYLVRARGEPVSFRLTCRLPAADETGGDIIVRVNGEVVGRLESARAWRTFEFGLPSGALRAGLNVVELEWPLREPAGEEEFERAARRLERGVYPDVLPVYGEVHAFTAR